MKKFFSNVAVVQAFFSNECLFSGMTTNEFRMGDSSPQLAMIRRFLALEKIPDQSFGESFVVVQKRGAAQEEGAQEYRCRLRPPAIKLNAFVSPPCLSCLVCAFVLASCPCFFCFLLLVVSVI